MNKVFSMAMLASLGLSAPTFAQSSNLPFKLVLGDDAATVKAKLKADMDPEPMARNPALPAGAFDVNKGKTFIHLRTKGVWVFFDRDGKSETIRLDAPFSGDVKGVKLGDDDKKLVAALGKPITKPGSAFLTMTAYKYVWDDSAYVDFDLNEDGVQYIFIHK
ncbi:hypothetical protein OL229_20880 [Neisseriaceae bacterium JH1-16]|nr:hypothetical protein [Neisseriaceae bacterium JH1-16]